MRKACEVVSGGTSVVFEGSSAKSDSSANDGTTIVPSEMSVRLIVKEHLMIENCHNNRLIIILMLYSHSCGWILHF